MRLTLAAIIALAVAGCTKPTALVTPAESSTPVFDQACAELKLQLETHVARRFLAELGSGEADDLDEAVAREMLADYRLVCRK